MTTKTCSSLCSWTPSWVRLRALGQPQGQYPEEAHTGALPAGTGGLRKARTCPGKGGRLPAHAAWLWLNCREIWDMLWPAGEGACMSFTPGTWTTGELEESTSILRGCPPEPPPPGPAPRL